MLDARALLSTGARWRSRVQLIQRRGSQDTRAIARRIGMARSVTGRFNVRSVAGDNQIQNGILQRRIAERFQIKSPAPAPTLGTEILPVALVDDLTKAEKADEVQECADGFRLAPAAGQIIRYGILNFLSIGTQLVMPRYVVMYNRDPANPCDVQWSFIDALGVPAFTPEYISKEVAGFPTAGIVANVEAPGVTPEGPACGRVTIPNLAGVTVDLEGYVIPPGKFLMFKTQDAAVSVSFSIRWREKPRTR